MKQISRSDYGILRELAGQVAEIAALPVQRETKEAWMALNELAPQRPMVMMDQIPWHEMNYQEELTLHGQDDFARGLENQMRRVLYRWRHMPVDMVVEGCIKVEKAIHNSGFGIERKEQISALDPQNDVVGHYYLDKLQDPEDLEKIGTPVVALNEVETRQRQEVAEDIFGGILEVRMQGLEPWCAPWDLIVQWRGVEATLYDLTDRPEYMHQMLERITSCYLAMLDSAQEQGLLAAQQDYIHCTGAWTRQLPQAGFDPQRPRTRDLWTFGMAQIFGSVSREMHEEFEIPYMQRIYSRFGLGYYGCCEPLDDRIDLVRKIPHVRKISMSPWTQQARGAAAIGGDFVFSRKPTPALLAVDHFNGGNVEQDLRETIRICREHGCPLELILKDISTVRYEPQRLWEWAKIATRLVRDGV